METLESDYISIEICQNCRLHRFCTRHDEKKYEKYFSDLSLLIQNNFPSLSIFKNKEIENPRLGAFEITFRNELIFSKIKSGMFPDLQTIIKKIKAMIEGDENIDEKNLNVRKKASINTNKKKEVVITKYDILSPSPTKIFRAYKNEAENSMLNKTDNKIN
jgi:selT/selW/selH-like putative selenoprotein